MPPIRKPLRRATLKANHQPKGNVNLFVGGKQILKPAALEIIKPTVGDACHLIYLDSAGTQMAESWHPTIEAAVYHAKWEYGLNPEEWEILNEGLGER